MRKSFFFSLILVIGLFFSVTPKLNAQTYTGNLTLNTQALVDAFNYTEVDGALTIQGLGITNLNGLSELTKCDNLTISCRDLTSIIGLANLTEVEVLLIFRRNASLTNLDGLSSLTKVGSVTSGGIIIEENESLLDLDGFLSLTYTRQLEIRDNPALTNIEGLSGPGFGFGDLIIDNNDDLVDLDGLELFNTFNGNIQITGNSSLVNVNGLSNIVNVEQNFSITDNPSLTSVGLTHLTYIILGGLDIRNNSSLTNLNGLESLDDVGHLSIVNNSSLVTINALAHLNTIRSSLSIINNDALVNLVGLTGLDFVYDNLNISDNASLVSIGSLLNFTSIGNNLIIKNNDALPSLTGLEKLENIYENLDISGNAVLTNFCALTKLFTTGNVVGTVSIINNGANTVLITAPADIILNNDPGQCSKDITAVVPAIATVSGCLKSSLPSSSPYPPGNIFPVGTTNIIWTATDGAGNTATAVQKVIITDNELPSITGYPPNVTVTCAADVFAANTASVTATDNCSVTISHVGDIITNQTCANRYTLTRTYKVSDASGNSVTRAQIITVNDNVPPQIIGLSTSKQILAPPNHKMQDITVNYSVTDNCNTSPTYSFNVSSSEPINGTGDGDTSPDWQIIDGHHIKLRAERAASGSGRVYTVTIIATDGCNAAVTSTADVVVAHNITGPHSGNAFKVGTTVAFTGEFWDAPTNKHTAKWLIDGSTTAKATVTEPIGNKNGKVAGSYKFTTPGVYKLQMNVTDQHGITTYANTNGDIEAIVVIYDPNGGHTYGGGYYDSPAGALVDDPSSTGKASYGFAMNYFKNSTNPKGETQFEFKVGDFEFNALNFDYLVISNSMAQYKGTGKIIGGQSGVAFIMTVTDGQLDGSGIDKIRMKIYNKNNGKIIYDNQPGASDAALPTQAVGANSLIVISGVNPSLTSANTNQRTEMEVAETKTVNGFDVIAYPNPTTNNFSITVQSDTKESIRMQIVDMYGRILETRNVSANSIVRCGDRYRAGTYFVRIIQGKKHKELKLVKLSD